MRQQWGRTLSVGRAPCGSALQTPESLRPQPSSWHAGAPASPPAGGARCAWHRAAANSVCRLRGCASSIGPGSAGSGSGAGCTFGFFRDPPTHFRVAVPFLHSHQQPAPAAVTKPHTLGGQNRRTSFSQFQRLAAPDRGVGAAAGCQGAPPAAALHSRGSSAPLRPPPTPATPLVPCVHTRPWGASASAREVWGTRLSP